MVPAGIIFDPFGILQSATKVGANLYFYRFFHIKRYGRDSNDHINSTRGRLHDTL